MCAYSTGASMKLLITCLFAKKIAHCLATGDIVGYVEFGEESLISCSKSKEEMATHMLAVFVRGNVDCYAVVAIDCALLTDLVGIKRSFVLIAFVHCTLACKSKCFLVLTKALPHHLVNYQY